MTRILILIAAAVAAWLVAYAAGRQIAVHRATPAAYNAPATSTIYRDC